jgi:alcohol dehydrogenase class IV
MKLRMLKRVFFPPEVCAGRDAMQRLSCLEASSRVLIAVSRTAAEAGLSAKLGALLKDVMAREVITWSGEPSVDTLRAMGETVAAVAPDWIVGVGGGAVLDAAKFLWAQYEHPELDFSAGAVSIPRLGAKARLALVPTTAGSGSEASQAAVLSNAQGAKVPYVSGDWIPSLVILDPSLTVCLPAAATVSTGFDALTHAIESAVSSLSHAMLRTLSADAVRGVLQYLPKVAGNPQDLAAREGMQNAAFLAGLCQSTASTGAAHAFSHATTGLYHTPHAQATAFYLLPTMNWNHAKNPKVYDDLAAQCGLADGAALISRVGELAGELGVPHRLPDLAGRVLNAGEKKALASAAARDVCMKTNPSRMSEQDAVDLLTALG